MLVCTSMYWFILVHTGTYCYILTGECVYLYIQVYTVTYKYRIVHTGTYQYKHVCTCTYWFILVHTGTYEYTPVHTSSYLCWSRFKKDANGLRTQDLLHTVRMHFHCTARVQTPNTGYGTLKWLCLYNDCAHSCLCIWLLTSDQRRRSRSAPASGHDVRRPDLDWNLRIARPCLPQSAGFNWCHPDAAFKMQVALSLAVPVSVPLPGAHWRPSHCVGPAFQLNPLTQFFF
jgi:hypothetical protein